MSAVSIHDRLAPRDERPPSLVAALVRRRPLAAFFALAFVYSWAPSLVYAVTGAGVSILSCGLPSLRSPSSPSPTADRA
jgi:hypothetical protein